MQRRNRRGLVLSESGIARVNRARRRLELDRNDGSRITLDQLGFEAGLSAKTMSRLFSGDVPVDRRTIELLFVELGLTLQPDDVMPPAARLLAERSQLPSYRTIMFGREEELARLVDLGRDRMLVTVTGAGGVGKTRLAVEWMHRVKRAYSHIGFLDLTLLTDTTTLREAIGTLLDGTAAGEEVLVILDGCEHLVQAAAATVSEMLDMLPHLSVLATSREPLGVAGEAVLRLAPLRVPAVSTSLRASSAIDAPAFAMFVERARSFDDRFALGDEATAVVAEIVRRLDGVPLALELAAARIAFMSPADLLESLRNHLDVLTEGPRIGVARHRSARALIDWSYQLLTPDERTIFARLSAFMGTFDAVAVAATSSSQWTTRDIGETLAGLGRKSLIIVDSSGRATRYRLLETIRQYAAAKLVESGDDATIRQLHALYYVDVVRNLVPTGEAPDTEASIHELQIELPNVREALKWSTSDSHNAYLAAAITASLIEFWEVRGEFVEAEQWLRRALQSAFIRDESRARLHEGLALTTYRRGLLDEAFDQASIALERYSALGDAPGQRRVRNVLGLTAMEAGEIATARSLFETNLEQGRAAHDARAVSVSLNNLGRLMAEREGNVELAVPLFVEALAIARAGGFISHVLLPLANLSKCALELQQYAAGFTYAQLGIAEAEKVGNREAIAGLSLQAVTHALYSGGLDAAREPALVAADAIADIPYRGVIAASLHDIGMALNAAGEPGRAATIFGAGDAYRRRGDALGSIVAGRERIVAADGIWNVLASGEGDALYTKGEILMLHDAFREALFEEPRSAPSQRSQ